MATNQQTDAMARRFGGSRGNVLLLTATAAALLLILLLTFTSRSPHPSTSSPGVAEQRNQPDSGKVANDSVQLMRDRQLKEILGRASKPDPEPSQPMDAVSKAPDGPVERQARETGALVIPPPAWVEREGEAGKDSSMILSKLVSSSGLGKLLVPPIGAGRAVPAELRAEGKDRIPTALTTKDKRDKQLTESELAGGGEEEMQEYYDGSLGPRFAPARPLDGYEDLVFCTIVPELNSTAHLALLRAFVGVSGLHDQGALTGVL